MANKLTLFYTSKLYAAKHTKSILLLSTRFYYLPILSIKIVFPFTHLLACTKYLKNNASSKDTFR